MRYVHGYSRRESERLEDQSVILETLLHQGTAYLKDELVLEAGCGIGAQTKILARRSPEAKFISIDVSEKSLSRAKSEIEGRNITNVVFQQENVMEMSFEDESFNHIFVCFVLEHLEMPDKTLLELKRVLKPGGSLTIIEGDHGSCFWSPQSVDSVEVWRALIRAQMDIGHDPLIGRRLYPLLKQAKFNIEEISPRFVYADFLNPDFLDGVVNNIIVPMVQSAKEQILSNSIVSTTCWDKGITELSDVGVDPDGTFFYTWFKALAYK